MRPFGLICIGFWLCACFSNPVLIYDSPLASMFCFSISYGRLGLDIKKDAIHNLVFTHLHLTMGGLSPRSHETAIALYRTRFILRYVSSRHTRPTTPLTMSLHEKNNDGLEKRSTVLFGGGRGRHMHSFRLGHPAWQSLFARNWVYT